VPWLVPGGLDTVGANILWCHQFTQVDRDEFESITAKVSAIWILRKQN